MQSALAWIWVPLALYALCLGLGLALETATRVTLPAAIVAPVGLCVGVVLVNPVYKLDGTVAVALGVLLVVALVGFVRQRGTLRGRLRPGPAAFAALATYVLYLAPSALSGHWTWAGYNFTNDPSNTLTATAWILNHGYTLPAARGTNTAITAAGGVDQGYPLGAHLLLGTAQPMFGVPLIAAYQTFIAFVAATVSATFAELGRRYGLRPAWFAVAAVTAAGANLLYVYGELGGLKEIATVSVIATACALAASNDTTRWTTGAVAAIVVVLAALLPILSAGGIAYAAVFGAGLLIVALTQRGQSVRSLAARALGGAVLFALLNAASLVAAVRFSSKVNDQIGITALGQLLRPLPFEQLGGVWFAEDWRLQVAPGVRWDVDRLLLALVFVFALVGIVTAIRRRPALVLGLASAGITAAVIAPNTAPYGDSKLMVILSPFIALMATMGAWALSTRWRLASALVTLGIAAGVVGSASIIYREVRLAPPDRIAALEDIARAAKGHGLVLHNEFEEYAKYFYRDAKVDVPVEVYASPKPAELRVGIPLIAQQYDLDEMKIRYVTSFPAIVLRKAPDTSRPPANFHLAYQNDFYELWLRDRRVRVVDHLPIQQTFAAQGEASCDTIGNFARRARNGESLVAARGPAPVVMDPTLAPVRSSGWPPSPTAAGTIVPLTPGGAENRLFVPGGTYRVWLYGSSGRPISAIIDGRDVGALKHVNTFEQWIQVGQVTLSRGRHELEIHRPGGSFAPGEGYQGRIGPLALEPVARETMLRVSPREADKLCGQSLDWIEIVAPPRRPT